jgi:hypothetical protein
VPHPLPTNDSAQHSSKEPSLVRFTEYIADTPDPDKADRIADMLLLFLAAGGTVLGSIGAAVVFLAAATRYAVTFVWMSTLIVTVGVGGLLGCATVMALLHFKGMITWENRRRQMRSVKRMEGSENDA